jgi:predicted DsbA family dithiol-disulfide isomerase
MDIEIFADVVCPWCYIGEKHLEKALAERPELQVEKHWRPFQLNTDIPKEGIPWKDFARVKFGGLERAESMFAHVSQVGAKAGIDLRFDKVATAANTIDAHRLIIFARDKGKEWEMVESLFAAYFTEGRNLNDTEHLVEAATRAGLDEAEVRDYLTSGENAEEVLQSQQMAAELGIQGVPFFIIDGKYGISGAQPVEVFLQALDSIQAGTVTVE